MVDDAGAAEEVVDDDPEEGEAETGEDESSHTCGDRLSCLVGSFWAVVGRKLGRDTEGKQVPLPFPFWCVETHAVVERIYYRGEAANDWEITCRPTRNSDNEDYQTGDDFEPSDDDDLIIVLVNTNQGFQPDFSEVAMKRSQYAEMNDDLAGWEDGEREEPGE